MVFVGVAIISIFSIVWALEFPVRGRCVVRAIDIGLDGRIRFILGCDMKDRVSVASAIASAFLCSARIWPHRPVVVIDGRLNASKPHIER